MMSPTGSPITSPPSEPSSYDEPRADAHVDLAPPTARLAADSRSRSRRSCGRRGRIRYALYASYVLVVQTPIEPISHPIRAWVPLGKAQRLGRRAYESPALPLSYSAVVRKLTEREQER